MKCHELPFDIQHLPALAPKGFSFVHCNTVLLFLKSDFRFSSCEPRKCISLTPSTLILSLWAWKWCCGNQAKEPEIRTDGLIQRSPPLLLKRLLHPSQPRQTLLTLQGLHCSFPQKAYRSSHMHPPRLKLLRVKRTHLVSFIISPASSTVLGDCQTRKNICWVNGWL